MDLAQLSTPGSDLVDMRKPAANSAYWGSTLGQRRNAARWPLVALFDPGAGPANPDAAFGTFQQSKKWQDD